MSSFTFETLSRRPRISRNSSKASRREDFLRSKLIRWAVVQRLGVIGEGAVKISGDVKTKHTSIGWSQIIGARNILVHTYFKIDWEIIWDTVQNDIPALKQQVLRIIEEDFADRLENEKD